MPLAMTGCLLTSDFGGLEGGSGPTHASAGSASGGGGHARGTGGSAGSAGGDGTGGTGGAAGTGGQAGTGGSVSGSGGALSFPATGVLDDFNRADGPPGLNWLNAGNYAVQGNQLA